MPPRAQDPNTGEINLSASSGEGDTPSKKKNTSKDDESTSSKDPFSAALAALSSGKGLEGSGAKSKADKQLAELEAKLKKQLQEQQYNYQLKLQEQQQKMALEELQAKQAYEKPFSEAELTGFYNGAETVNLKQLNQQGSQFNQSLQQQQTEFTKTLEQKVLDRELDTMRLDLDKLTQQQQNAIQQGQLDLEREIETEKLALQKEIQRGELALETSKTTGKMPDGTFTDAARAARVNEAMEMAKITGQVVPSYVTSSPTGNVGGFSYNDEASYNEAWRQASAAGTAPATQMTDAAQQWRAQAGLDYAKTAAQLAQSPENYFEAAAFMRNGAADASRGYLADINTQGLGSNVGFRSAGGNLPGTASMQTVAGQGTPTNPAPITEATPSGGFNEGPSPSITNAEGVRAGEGEIYTTTMHKEGVPAQTQTVPTAFRDQFGAAQTAMPSPQPGNPQGIPTPAAAIANVGDPYSIEDRARLNQYGQVFKAGAHKLAPGSLEAMNPTERSLFNSAAKASGIRPEDFDTQYKRSRLQTDVSAMAL